MTRGIRRIAVLALGALTAALTVTAAPAPVMTTGIIKDREGYIPHRKYAPMPGKVVALLVSDVVAKMGHEGRSGAADNMALSLNGNSYRWVYVPVTANPQINGLQVKIGEKGDRVQVYPSLSMANARTVAQWDIKVPYALVEVEVNGGQGSPPEEGFVATKMTRLDGTKEYPFNVTEVISDVRKRYTSWKTEQKDKLDESMLEAQKKALKDRKPTGPRETQELVYMTWLPESKRLRINFRTTLTDGEYKFTPGGIGRDRFRLPPPPIKGGPPLPVPPAPPAPPAPQGFAAFPPPPPPPFRRPSIRYGTTFGIEYGMAYEVTPSGKVDRILTLPAQSFVKELPIPPGFGPIGPADRLPPQPLPPVKN